MRPRLRRRSVRLRLALWYASVFFLFGAALLGVSYVVVRHELGPRAVRVTSPLTEAEAQRLPAPDDLEPGDFERGTFERPVPEDERVRFKVLVDSLEARTATGVRNVLIAFAAALLLSTIASLAMGWWLAGRALAPVSRITESARRVSQENLQERIALEGPDDELKELADTFDAMLGKLDRAFEGQRRFVAHASHELRTPLAVMRTALDVTAEDGGYDDPEAVAEMVAMLRRSVARSEALVDRLLALATGAADIDRRGRVRLGPLTADVLDDLALRAAEAEITMTASGLDDDVVVHGDEVLLRHLVHNLVENAVVHNRPNGRVDITCEQAGDAAVGLRITNDGPVVAAAAADLLQPFRRAAARGRPGYGLGLSIVDAVVQAHDGTLSIRAREGGGLDVEVQLPTLAPAPALHV